MAKKSAPVPPPVPASRLADAQVPPDVRISSGPEDSIQITVEGTSEVISDDANRQVIERLVSTLAGELEIETGDRILRARLLSELGQIDEEFKGELRSARQRYRGALEADPTRPSTLRALGRIERRNENTSEAIRLLQLEIGLAATDAERAGRYLELGRLHEMRDEPEQAIEAYRRTLELDPGNIGALESLAALYQTGKQWVALSECLLRAASSTRDLVRRASLTARAALVRDAHLGQEGPAEALLATALRQCPREPTARPPEPRDEPPPSVEIGITVDSDLTLEEDLGASVAGAPGDEASTLPGPLHSKGGPYGLLGLLSAELSRLYRKRGRWNELAHLDREESRHAEDDRLRSMRLYRAGRLFAERVGDPDAAEACFEEASQLAPDDELASLALAEIQQRRGKWSELEQTLRDALPRFRSRDRAVATLVEIARLRLEKLARPEDAVTALRQALELDPQHLPTFHRLEDVLLELERFEELVEVIQTETTRLHEPSARADVYYELGQLVERHLDDPDRAAFLYRSALDLVPGHCPAMDALDRLLSARESWDELVTLLEAAARMTPDRSRAAARLWRAAQIAEHRLDDPHRAIDLTQQLLELRGDDLDAISSIGRLLERTGRWEERISWLRREVELSQHEPERIALLMGIASMFEVRLEAPQHARDIYLEVVGRDPSNRAALRALERLDRRSGHFDALLETLNLQLAACSPGRESAELYSRIGRILEDRLGRNEEALEAFRAALAQDRDYEPAVNALERLMASLGLWSDLAALLEERARTEPDQTSRAVSWFRVGELREDRLDDEDGAHRAYLEALRQVADFEPAREGIARILLGQGDWSQVAEELAVASTMHRGARRLRDLTRLAHIRDMRLDDKRGALAALNEAAKLAPGDLITHETMARVCREQGLWQHLGTAYRQLAANIDDPRDAASVLHRAALDAQAHPAVGDATSILWEILRLSPSDHAAIRALEESALRSGDHRTLLDVTTRMLDLEEPLDVLVKLHVRRGMLLASVGDDTAAYDAFRRALDLDGRNISALSHLARIVDAQGRYDELAELRMQESSLLRDPEERTRALMSAGRIYLGKLAQRDEAAAAFTRVMEIEPGHTRAFQLLSGILEESERWPELAEAIRSRLVTVTEDSEELTLRLRLSAIERDKLGAPELALKTLQGLLELDPNNRKALENIGGLYVMLERWREASEAYEKAIAAALARSESHAVQRCRRVLAELRIRRLDELEAAVVTLEEALAQDPKDGDVLRLLVEAHQRRGDIASTAIAMKKLAASMPVGSRAPVLSELADVLREQLNDFGGAGEALKRAVVDAPEDPKMLARLREHFTRRGDDEGLARALTWIVDKLGGDPAKTAVIRVHLGKTLIEKLDKVAAGVEQLEVVLRTDPANPSARFAMARRHLLPPGRPDLAEQQYRAVLAEDPWNLDALRRLFKLLAAGSAPLRTQIVALLLAYLGDAEAASVAHQTRTPARRALGPDGYHKWVADSVEPMLFCSLLRSVQSSLERVYPPDLERHGVSREDRSTGADHLGPAVEEVASRLGVEAWETYVSQRNRHVTAVEPGDPPKVVVGVGLRNLSAGTRRFEIGRVVGSIVGGSLLFEKVPRREIPALLSAIIGTSVRGYSRMGQPNEVVDLTKRVSRALPRKLRKALEEDARLAASKPPPDIDAWVAGSSISADRCGLLACADIGAALDALRSREEHRAPLPHETVEQRISALRGFEPAEALTQYWLSNRCEEALAQIGIF